MDNRFLILLLLLAACSTPEQKRNTDPDKEILDTLTIEATKNDTAQLILQRDSLLKNFDYKSGDFSVPTYYHKNWWGRYTIRDHALTAGVDSLGGLFLTACSFVENITLEIDYDRAEIAVEIGDTVYNTNKRMEAQKNYFLEKGIIEKSIVPGAWSPVVCVFLNGAENGVIMKIAEHYDQPIQFYFTINGNKISPEFPLSKRDKIGIKDCYELSVVLKKLIEVREL